MLWALIEDLFTARYLLVAADVFVKVWQYLFHASKGKALAFDACKGQAYPDLPDFQ